jgi:hypothetical protein
MYFDEKFGMVVEDVHREVWDFSDPHIFKFKYTPNIL